VPKYSRRARLAQAATDGTNRAFRRNIANRLWAHMMGRGLVHPVDLHHPENPPTHPELLDMLADGFGTMKYDVKAFLRELALSGTYQQSFEMPGGMAERTQTAIKQLPLLEAEHKRLEAVLVKSREAEAKIKTALEPFKKAVDRTQQELAKENAAGAKKPAKKAAKALAKIRQQFTAKQKASKAVAVAVAKTVAARKLLPRDAGLALAVRKLKVLSNRLAKELAVIQKRLSAREAAVKAAADKRVAARKAVNGIVARLAAAKQPFEATKKQFVAVRTQREVDLTAANVVRKRIEILKAFADYGTLAATAAASRAAQKSAADRSFADAAYAKLAEHWTNQFAVSMLKPLTPEQLAWGTMQAVGLVDQQRAAAEAKLNKKTPKESFNGDPAKLAMRAAQIERAVFHKLKGNVGEFVKLFGGGSGQPQQEFFTTVDQALFFANGAKIQGWLVPRGGNLTARLIQRQDPQALADELYLSVLSRRPTQTEIAGVTQYIEARPKNRTAVVRELVWALLTSSEFRFNH